MRKRVAVIGGGPAGMEASATLTDLGYEATLIEVGDKLGGHLREWDRLFPSQRPAEEVLNFLVRKMDVQVKVITSAEINEIQKKEFGFRIFCHQRPSIEVDAILISTGFQVFDATKKEEYGFGIYDHVITSAQLEESFRQNRQILGAGGKTPGRVGFIHCVGSRDEKSGNVHCSKVCCVTAVKQAIEIKQKYPDTEVFCFYMDLRMFGLGYEELYKESQERYGVQFIRGRLSEAFENTDGTVMIKVEDTLTGKPLKIKLDLMVLMVGMVPSAGTKHLGKLLGLEFNPNGFLVSRDEHTMLHDTQVRGVFITGAARAPKNVEETLTDARSAAIRVDQYLRQINY